MTKVRLKVSTIDLSELTERKAVDFIATKVERAFGEELGPHLVDVARKRAPVSTENRSEFNKSSFQRVRLRPERDFPGGPAGSSAARSRNTFLDLQELERSGRTRALREIGGSTRNPRLTRFFQGTGANRGKSPTEIKVQGGTIRGAFRNRPGTLRDSIRFDGVQRTGNQVKATVRAHAPYARYVHDGFTHRGGRGHKGTSTHIPGRPFLGWALDNVRDRLKNKSTYKG